MVQSSTEKRNPYREAVWSVIEKTLETDQSPYSQFLRGLFTDEKIDSRVKGQLREELINRVAESLVLQMSPTEGVSLINTTPSELPEKAPELYAERRNRTESPPEFLLRVWKPWIDAKLLYQFRLGTLDPSLLTGLKSFCQKRGKKVSEFLPGKREFVQRRDEGLRTRKD